MADDASSFLTVAELASRLGVSDTTIRNWRRTYGGLIHESVGADGVRRYPLGRFEVIAMLRERNLPPGEIRAALAEGQSERVSAESSESRMLALLEQIAADVRRIADHLAPRDES